MKIFVGCSSKEIIDKKYLDLASQVSELLKNDEVFIGGTPEGMMGRVVKCSHHYQMIALDCYVTEEFLKNNSNITICNNAFERMSILWESVDVLLFLPGGTGTLAEIMMFLEESRTSIEKKKLILFNYDGFYNSLLEIMEENISLKFADRSVFEKVNVISNILELEEILKGMKK